MRQFFGKMTTAVLAVPLIFVDPRAAENASAVIIGFWEEHPA